MTCQDWPNLRRWLTANGDKIPEDDLQRMAKSWNINDLVSPPVKFLNLNRGFDETSSLQTAVIFRGQAIPSVSWN
jgi:hypothetical protein